MSLNGSGVYQVNSTGQPVVAATLIDATVFNALTSDLATALSTAIFKDGQQTVTADIPFNAHKLTGIGAGSARTDAASLATIQDGTGAYVPTVGGTVDVITLTASPPIAAYVAGQTFRFIASGANTTNVTVAINGLAAKAVTKNGTTALIANDIASGKMVTISYDGTRFILSSVSTTQFLPLTGGTMTGALVTSGGVTVKDFPSGTLMLFVQTAAPTGWTKGVTHNDKALRVVTGAAGTGGSVAFTTAFAAGSIPSVTGSHVLTTPEIPAHSHVEHGSGVGGAQLWNSASSSLDSGSDTSTGASTSNTGGGGGHTHTIAGQSLAVSYVDIIIASKD